MIPVLFLGIHPQDLHLPQGVDRILNGVFQALTDIPDTAHACSLITVESFLIGTPSGNGARTENREIRERQSRKISHLRDFKHTLRKNGDQVHMGLPTFCINTLNALQTATGGEDINPFG